MNRTAENSAVVFAGGIELDRIAFFRDLAVIIVSAKVFGLIAQRLKAPSVVGEIIAGLLLGPSVFGLVGQSDYLSLLAEIGVVLLMFDAGLETNMKDLLKTGPKAFAVACSGVFVPLVGGTLLYMLFYGVDMADKENFYRAVFIGTIMTATSVGITVSALKELGHLKDRIGTLITSAAIIDDVIGIIVLTFVIGLRNPDSDPITVLWKTGLFIVLSIGIGFLLHYAFKWADKKWPHQRRIPILGLALCMFLAFAAETFFGIADITGAYIAGLILCTLSDSDYIARKVDINSYMIFGPVFFASIGLKTSVSGVTTELLLFSLGFIAVAMVTKIIGCGLVAKIFGNSFRDSMKVGVGMMTRGEVALIVAQKGLSEGMLDAKYFTSVILLIIVSSISVPIILKLLYKGEPAEEA
ncbi:MAG: cation:proton antiporter [Oscillospiraceae bacterium]|nr:cation:proton antiporter [Oscillospiraceae bacterium]